VKGAQKPCIVWKSKEKVVASVLGSLAPYSQLQRQSRAGPLVYCWSIGTRRDSWFE